jgi:hypothetical protein
MKDRMFSTVVNGKRVSGAPDTVAEIHGQNTAVESKFVANWARRYATPPAVLGRPVGGARRKKPWSLKRESMQTISRAALSITPTAASSPTTTIVYSGQRVLLNSGLS